jgi:predicted RNA-binding Zn-ribbon protein involved in translation (DUF1610 family)
MDPFIVIAIFIAIFGGLIMSAVRSSQGKATVKEIGNARCDRCGHVGPLFSKTQVTFNEGFAAKPKFTCSRCGSENWTRV